ncbi:MAG: hypothetical protein E6343_13145 [Clostridium perfringens]|nr:hypothetical protein [Clostridium perfringens]
MEILIILCTIISAMAMIISIIAMSTLKYLYNSKETSKNSNLYDEAVEDNEVDIVQKAIIMLGDEKIEVEVDCYEIDYNIIKITDKYGEVYLTYTKNVLLTSGYII